MRSYLYLVLEIVYLKCNSIVLVDIGIPMLIRQCFVAWYGNIDSKMVGPFDGPPIFDNEGDVMVPEVIDP